MDEDVIQKPAKSANKPEWVAYAVSQGMDEAEAEAMSKPALIEKYADAGEDSDGETTDAEAQVEAASKAGEKMTAPDANPLVKAGAEDLPPQLRAGAVHRAVVEK